MTDPILAQQVANTLAPALPYLTGATAAAGTAAIKSVGEKIGLATWNKAVSIWKKILPEVEKRPEIAKAIQEVADKANDPRTEALLSWQLEKLDLPLETLAEIHNILVQKEPEYNIVHAERGGVSVVGPVHGSTITTSYHGYETKPG